MQTTFSKNLIEKQTQIGNRISTMAKGWMSIFLRKGSLSIHVLFQFCFVLVFVFLGLHTWHMEVPRLGVQSELQLPAYARATATPDSSHVCDPHHSSQQHQILNPVSEARNRTCNLMVPSQIHFHCATMGTPDFIFFTHWEGRQQKYPWNQWSYLGKPIEEKEFYFFIFCYF